MNGATNCAAWAGNFATIGRKAGNSSSGTTAEWHGSTDQRVMTVEIVNSAPLDIVGRNGPAQCVVADVN